MNNLEVVTPEKKIEEKPANVSGLPLSNPELGTEYYVKFFVKVKRWARGVWFAVLGKTIFPSWRHDEWEAGTNNSEVMPEPL